MARKFLAVAALILNLVRAQAPTARPAFEAVSVRPNTSLDDRGSSTLTRRGGHVEIHNATLRGLIAQAYDFPNLSLAEKGILGMPRWGDLERFDIQAESPGDPTLDQKRSMLQSLLADRFHLAVHQETRELPVYALVPVKPGSLGPQLHRHTDDAPCQPLPDAGTSGQSGAEAALAALRKFPCGRIAGGILPQGGPNPVWSGGRKVTMAAIAESLGGDEYIDRPAIDQTGWRGAFDFTIEWNTHQQDLAAESHPDAPGLSLFEAVRQQLGLKVEPGNGPVSVLVVDHVERPTGN